jgi:AraC family transcriptional regulator
MESSTKSRNRQGSAPDCRAFTTVRPEYPYTPPLGRHIRKLQLSDFVLTESLYEPCSVVPEHAHLAPTLVLVVAGEAVEKLATTSHNLTPGSLIIRPPRETHSDHNGKRTVRLLNIEVLANMNGPLHDFTRVFGRPAYLRGGLLPALAQRIYKESKIKDSAANIVIEGLILEMLGTATRSLITAPVTVPQWLRNSRDLLHEHFAEQLTLSDIAKTVGAHPTHLARSFKKHYGTTVGEYIRRLRLDWAATQLANTDDTIAEIAAAAGFYDQSHFSHSLKKYLGVSPLEFRDSRLRK